MMLDKELFYSLCEQYGVKFSDKYNKPMIKDETGIHAIAAEDVKRILNPHQVFFGYSGKTIDTKYLSHKFYAMDDDAIAC